MDGKKCVIKMTWFIEDDKGSWCATSSDIPGLVLGADSFDVLADKVRVAAPEMLECNLNYTGPIILDFYVERVDYLDSAS